MGDFIGRRYVLHNKLGAGGMGAVYRAVDRLSGQVVALKRVTNEKLALASISSGVDLRLALAQEFKTLASLRHPNIISVLDYGFSPDGEPFFTMELVEDARTIFDAAQPLNVVGRVNLLVQMLQALAYLHRRGILHRDLKPGNVLTTPAGHVKLLDFGLSVLAARGDHAPQRPSAAGTLGYMAPEVLMGEMPTVAADLYGVGMIAYEMFAGKPAFDPQSINQLLRDVMQTAPDVESLDIPVRLALVLETLLSKDPLARYMHGGEPALRVIAALCEAVGEPVPPESVAIRESFLQAAKLVERDAEIAHLTEALENLRRGVGSMILIAGESGVGKTRLLDELRALALVKGVLVLRGQAVAEGGGLYHAWRPVLRWLCMMTPPDAADAAALRPFVPDIADLTGCPVPDLPPDAPQAAHEHLLAAISRLFRRAVELDGQRGQLIVMLEDLHWASESFDLMVKLLPLTDELPLLLLGSYRDDERPEIGELLPQVPLIKLKRLSEIGIMELVQAMLGAGNTAVFALLQRETEGNAFFIVETVRALAEEAGELHRVTTMDDLPEHLLTGGMQRIVLRRLDRVPERARDLLNRAAVTGRQIDIAVLAMLAPDPDLEPWLRDCADAAVLEVFDDGRNYGWRFAHDKLREGVLSALSDPQRRAAHAEVAAMMETLYSDSPDHAPVLAYHWREAGDMEKALDYFTRAGDQAMRAGLNREATRFFQQAIDALLQAPPGDDLRRRLVELAVRYGRVISYAPTETALTYLHQALEAAEALADEAAQARVLSSIATLHHVMGHIGESLRYFDRSRALAEALDIEELLVLPYNVIGRALAIAGQYPPAIDMLARGIPLAEKYHDVELHAGSLAYYAAALLSRGQSADTDALIERALNAARQLGHPDRLAGSYAAVGYGLALSGQLERALPLLTDALDIAESAGATTALYVASGLKGYIYLQHSEIELAAAHLDRALRVADETRVLLLVPAFSALRAEIDLRLEHIEETLLARVENALHLADYTNQMFAAAVARLVLAKCYAARRDLQQAEHFWEASTAIHRAWHCPPLVASNTLEGARLMLAAGSSDHARKLAAQALVLAERMHMKWHAEQSRMLLKRFAR